MEHVKYAQTDNAKNNAQKRKILRHEVRRSSTAALVASQIVDFIEREARQRQ